MRVGLFGMFAVIQREWRNERATLNHTLRSDVGDVLDDKVAAADRKVVTFVPQLLQVGIKTD